MFTPNGQLFVDNKTGILKFKINNMEFTGNTLREVLNSYRNYKHLPELTNMITGKIYLETLAGLPQAPLIPHPPEGKKPSKTLNMPKENGSETMPQRLPEQGTIGATMPSKTLTRHNLNVRTLAKGPITLRNRIRNAKKRFNNADRPIKGL